VTNHKCGTCRFYEVGAQLTHGWCRNPAYPRRDDVALLRNDELACRSGWGKDFWAARDVDGGIAPSRTQPSDETTQPIPVPIGTGIAQPHPIALAEAPTPPAATGIPPRQAAHHDGAQRAPNVVSVSAKPLTNAPKDGTMKTTPPLSRHPELNELGVPIRAPKRTSVAEAHRRAMERRALERQTKEERDRLATQEALKQAEEARARLTKIAGPTPEQRPIAAGLNDFGTPSLPSAKTPFTAVPKEEQTAPKREPARGEAPGPKRELALPAIAAPTLPRPREADTPTADTPTFAASVREPEDVIISTGEMQQDPTDTSGIPSAHTPDTTAPTPAVRDGFRHPDPAPEPRIEARQVTPVAATAPPAEHPPSIKEGRPAPYWDQPGAVKGPERLRPGATTIGPAGRNGDGASVRAVGREPTGAQPHTPSTRPIKPLGGSIVDNTPISDEARTPVAPVRPPKAAEVQQTIAAPPAPVERAPRQIDESLLRQLEQGWQAQQLEAHAGRRCGTCRFFQPTEMGRGTCACPFAPVHRRQTVVEGLPCATALGTWWAAPDEGWLERTERRPRRATPLLDALLRERETMEPFQTAPPLRRGAR
jgi:hypothetical protein